MVWVRRDLETTCFHPLPWEGPPTSRSDRQGANRAWNTSRDGAPIEHPKPGALQQSLIHVTQTLCVRTTSHSHSTAVLPAPPAPAAPQGCPQQHRASIPGRNAGSAAGSGHELLVQGRNSRSFTLRACRTKAQQFLHPGASRSCLFSMTPNTSFLTAPTTHRKPRDTPHCVPPPLYLLLLHWTDCAPSAPLHYPCPPPPALCSGRTPPEPPVPLQKAKQIGKRNDYFCHTASEPQPPALLPYCCTHCNSMEPICHPEVAHRFPDTSGHQIFTKSNHPNML